MWAIASRDKTSCLHSKKSVTSYTLPKGIGRAKRCNQCGGNSVNDEGKICSDLGGKEKKKVFAVPRWTNLPGSYQAQCHSAYFFSGLNILSASSFVELLLYKHCKSLRNFFFFQNKCGLCLFLTKKDNWIHWTRSYRSPLLTQLSWKVLQRIL